MKPCLNFRSDYSGARSQLQGLIDALDELWPEAAAENLALALAVVRHRRLARLVTDNRFNALAKTIATMTGAAEDESLSAAGLDDLADDGA